MFGKNVKRKFIYLAIWALTACYVHKKNFRRHSLFEILITIIYRAPTCDLRTRLNK